MHQMFFGKLLLTMEAFVHLSALLVHLLDVTLNRIFVFVRLAAVFTIDFRFLEFLVRFQMPDQMTVCGTYLRANMTDLLVTSFMDMFHVKI